MTLDRFLTRRQFIKDTIEKVAKRTRAYKQDDIYINLSVDDTKQVIDCLEMLESIYDEAYNSTIVDPVEKCKERTKHLWE